MGSKHIDFMRAAIAAGKDGVEKNKGGPFGCVIVKDGEIIAEGCNHVTSLNDPTAHAEVVAIRKACKILNHFELKDCILYTSCEPCPMCLGAIYWARPKAVYYACIAEDANSVGFDDSFIYKELVLPHSERSIPMNQIGREESLDLFRKWEEKKDRSSY